MSQKGVGGSLNLSAMPAAGRRRRARGLAISQIAVLLLLVPACFAPSRPAVRTPFEIGRDAAASGDYATAIAQLTLAVETTQDFFFTSAYLERGECHLKMASSSRSPIDRQQHLTRALEDFDLVLKQAEIEPAAEARALYNRGSILLAQQQGEGAEAAFQRVLTLELPPGELYYKLESHRRLGWMYLEKARTSLKEGSTALEELESQEKFRQAQEQFSSGLQIEPEDHDINLGKGLCLHFRGQDREAIAYLKKSTEVSELKGRPNPRGHYYLARATELQSGLQEAALEHYSKAVAQDEERAFTPLYTHLVEVLPVYITRFEDPRFDWYLDNMLAYAGDSADFWTSMESLAARLLGKDGEATTESLPQEALRIRNLGIFARALARARNKKIDEAVADALLLKARPDFLELVSRVFPIQPPIAEYLYGKALTLLGAKRYEDLEAFFQEAFFQSLAPEVKGNVYYHRTMVLQGRSILERWLAENGDMPALNTPEAKLDRDKKLGKARDSFQTYLELHPEDHEIRMALGRVQEMMESYAAAFLSYAMVAKEAGDKPEAVLRIIKLHSARLLPQSDMAEAWRLLRSYTGSNLEIQDYIRRTRDSIQAEVALYCTECGRKGVEGDTICLECGRQIGPTARAEVTKP